MSKRNPRKLGRKLWSVVPPHTTASHPGCPCSANTLGVQRATERARGSALPEVVDAARGSGSGSRWVWVRVQTLPSGNPGPGEFKVSASESFRVMGRSRLGFL